MSFSERLDAVTQGRGAVRERTGPDHADDDGTDEVGPGLWGAVLTVTAIVVALYSYLGIERQRSYRGGAYDLALFSQAVDHLSRFEAPVSTIKGYAEGVDPAFNLWGDHSHYVIALWAPLWRLYPHPVTLIVQQAFLVGLCLPAVWLVARRRLGGTVAPFTALLAVAAAWGVGSAMGFDVHEVAFELPLLAWAVERGLAGRWNTSTLLVLLLLVCKEDTGFTVAALGIWTAILGQRVRGAVVVLAGIGGYVLTTQVLIPAVSGHDYAYWTYTGLGADAPDALGYIARHPFKAVHLLLDNGRKQRTLVALLLPALPLGLLSPLLVVVVPLLLARFWSDSPSLWGTSFHYSALPCLVLVLAAVDGLARWRGRLRPRLPRFARVLPALGLVALLVQTTAISATLRGGFGSVPPFPGKVAASERTAYDAAVATVPHDVAVTASNSFVPHLLDRCGKHQCDVRLLEIVVGSATGPNNTRQLPQPFPDPVTPWILVDTSVRQYPDVDKGISASYVTILEGRGWVVAYDGGGVQVLHH